MAFLIFMICMVLLIPLTMIIFGIWFIRSAPKEINQTFGYRTDMSMKNRDTWQFAHKYCGKQFLIFGLIMLPLSAAAMYLSVGADQDAIGFIGGAICFVQTIPMIVSIVLTEKALRNSFDTDGNRR